MKVFKKINDELVELKDDDTFFNINTHSGSTVELELILRKEDEKKITDLMMEFDVTDSDTTYKLKRNSELDDFVFYYRALTERNLYFNLDVLEKINDGEEVAKRIKPDKNGVFLLKSEWNTDEDLKIKLTTVCEEGFSEEFGEKKLIILGMQVLGVFENATESFI